MFSNFRECSPEGLGPSEFQGKIEYLKMLRASTIAHTISTIAALEKGQPTTWMCNCIQCSPFTAEGNHR